MEWITNQLKLLAGTRWVVVLGILAAIFVLVAAVVGGTRLVPAFFLALGAHASVVGLAGVSRRIWQGADVSSAPVPGGGALDVETVQKVQDALDQLNERVETQMHDLNRRMYDVEKAVFKGADEGNDETE